jgi:hypothetical protein
VGRFLFLYGDLLSAFFGLISAIILASPALSAISSKQHWEALRKLERENRGDAPTSEAISKIFTFAIAPQLGDDTGAALVSLLGFGCLFVSFIFLMIASIGRIVGYGG